MYHQFSSIFGRWRGPLPFDHVRYFKSLAIEHRDIEHRDPSAWFASYRDVALAWADLAEDEGAE